MKKKKSKKVPEHTRRHPVTRIHADIKNGLSTAQAQEYARCGWTNAPVEPPLKTVPEIIRSNLFTYFNLVFAVLAVLLIIAGSFRSLTFLPVVLANLLIGIIQEVRAKNALGKLSMLHAPKVLVVRDGQLGTIRQKSWCWMILSCSGLETRSARTPLWQKAKYLSTSRC